MKILLPLSLALFASSSPVHAAVDDPAVLAQRFLDSYSLGSATPAEVPLRVLLDEHFMGARAGLFDLRIPTHSMTDKRLAGNFISLVEATLLAQKGWLEWMGASAEGGAGLLDDIKVILKEFKRFKPDHVTQSVKGDEHDFFKIVGMSEPGLEALKRLSEAMGTGAPLKLARADKPSQIAIFPDRKQFVEFIAYVGWSDDTKKQYYWVDGTDVWSECFVDDTRATCLQFPAIERGDYTKGSNMNEKNPKEMEQQLTQIAGMSLFENFYGTRLPAALIGGLANNLVIQVFGEVDTRLDGSVKGKQTQARSVFIAGGNSDGGLLPKNSADNRWRENYGRYHFIRALRNAQKAGKAENKSTKHKYKSFLLASDNGSKKHVVTAPIFGTPAAGRPAPPPEVLDDFIEFLRAYKSGFLFWLQTESEGKKKSEARFAEFLASLAQGEPKDFEQAVVDFYGVPLSTTDVGKEDLEGRFLKFVSK